MILGNLSPSSFFPLAMASMIEGWSDPRFTKTCVMPAYMANQSKMKRLGGLRARCSPPIMPQKRRKRPCILYCDDSVSYSLLTREMWESHGCFSTEPIFRASHARSATGGSGQWRCEDCCKVLEILRLFTGERMGGLTTTMLRAGTVD